MCGVSLGPIDPERLIYYTFCTAEGLTFHKRALSALRQFLNARFYMYENVYFHRVGHAIDIHLREIFRPTLAIVLPRSPLDDTDAYRRLTEWSLFTTMEAWLDEPLDSERRLLAEEWQSIIHRHVKYSMVYEHAVELQRPAPATRELTPAEFKEAVVRHLPAGIEGHRLRGRHRLAGPAAAQPPERPEAHPGVRPADGSDGGAGADAILEFVPAKAHLYRVFAVGHEHDHDLARPPGRPSARSRRRASRTCRRRPSPAAGRWIAPYSSAGCVIRPGTTQASNSSARHVAQGEGGLPQRRPSRGALLRDLGRLLVADVRAERGDEHERIVQVALDDGLVGAQALGAEAVEGAARIAQELQRLEHVVDDDRLVDVELEVALRRREATAASLP